MKYVAQISQNILWTVAQRNGLTEHNRPVLLKKTRIFEQYIFRLFKNVQS